MNNENGGGIGKKDAATWVLQNIQSIIKLLGVSFEGLDEHAINLFKEIERRRKEKGYANSALSAANKK